jgi:hypothetical protein
MGEVITIPKGWLWPAGTLLVGAALVLAVELWYQVSNWWARRR